MVATEVGVGPGVGAGTVDGSDCAGVDVVDEDGAATEVAEVGVGRG